MSKTLSSIAIGLAAILGGCSAGADKIAAEASVAQFHRMLDTGRYHDIYAVAGPEFRRAASEPESTRFLQTVHERLGRIRGSVEQGWRVNFTTAGNIVNLGYETEFSSGRGNETFVFRVSGGTAQLLSYNINSRDLIVNASPAPGASEPPGPNTAVVPITVVPNSAQPAAGKPSQPTR
jgi:hypothetical protein